MKIIVSENCNGTFQMQPFSKFVHYQRFFFNESFLIYNKTRHTCIILCIQHCITERLHDQVTTVLLQ